MSETAFLEKEKSYRVYKKNCIKKYLKLLKLEHFVFSRDSRRIWKIFEKKLCEKFPRFNIGGKGVIFVLQKRLDSESEVLGLPAKI